MAHCKTRSGSVLFKIQDLVFKERQVLDLSKPVQVPTVRYVVERFFTIKMGIGVNAGRELSAIREAAFELQEIWIFLNLQPKCHSQIVIDIKKLIQEADKLKRYPVSKQGGAAFKKLFEQFLLVSENGFDIRTSDALRMEELEERYFVKVTEDSEEEKIYQDNCVPLLEDNPPYQKGKCPRLMWSTTKVDKVWLAEALERLEKIQEGEMSAARKAEKKIKDASLAKESEQRVQEFFKGSEDIEDTDDLDADFATDATSSRSDKVDADQPWPQIKTRDGYRKMNVQVMEVLMVMVSSFGVSENKAAACLQMVLNRLCGQKLELPNPKVSEMEDSGSSTRKWKVGDLTYTLPTPQTIHTWIEDGALLSLWHVADEIKVASENPNAATTLGTDDTVKAQGFRRADVKTGHVTIVEQKQDKKIRTNFSLGYYPNISHAGADSAITVSTVLDMLAVVSNSKLEEVKDSIDWFQGDRAGDNLVMLEELDIKEEKTVKCNAHVCLAIEEAVDSVMLDTEVKVGKDKLISTDASHVFSSSGTSIATLGLIAIAKQFSPSHCQESVSQFTTYKSFLLDKASDGDSEAKALLKKGFLGFSSNRFGRRSALASMVLQHLPFLKEFMAQNVDEFQNKLSLANSIYINNDWFILCCRIMAKFDQILVTPLLMALGVDHHKKKHSEYRSWAGLKTFFTMKLTLLEELTAVSGDSSAFDLLVSRCSSKVKQSMDRQLSYVQFYKSDDMSQEQQRKLELCPLTNSNCEGEFAQLDNAIRRVGGTVSIQTLSNRHLVASNKLFSSDKWRTMTPAQQRLKFHWSRSSAQAKKVKAIGKEYMDKVKAADKISLKLRAEAKQKKLKRSLKLLETVKAHGGPVTEFDLILSEIAYLRVTVAPEIKQKRKLPSGKFETFKTAELKSQIRTAIKPEKSELVNVDNLVIEALADKLDDPNSNTRPGRDDSDGSVASTKEGTVAVFVNEGSLGEEFLGAVISQAKVQPYKCSSGGFVPDGVSVSLKQVKLVKEMDPGDFVYILKGSVMYLKLKN